MEIKGEKVEKEYVTIKTTIPDCIKAMFEECKVPFDIQYKDDKFYYSEDISHHGSPFYEDKYITPKKGIEKLVIALIGLREATIECDLAFPIDYY